MSSNIRNIIIAGALLILFAGAGWFVWDRLGLRNRLTQNNPSDTTPLKETPGPTTFPFVSPTPFPLITLPTPLGSLRPSGSPPAPVIQCQYLLTEPSEGVVPLSIKFTATGIATSGSGRNYEFDFGDGSAKVKQTGPSASHKYEKAGTYNATLKVTDSSGNTISLGSGECRRSITVRSLATPVASGKTTTLPKTGPEGLILVMILPLVLLGMYLYKRFRLI